MDILHAESKDFQQLLTLQYLAYQYQAELNNDFTIPPLTETLEDVQRDSLSVIILKAVTDDGTIVGSVRGRIDCDTCHVGRLFVHPDYQGHGLGTRLLSAIEAACPKIRYELFTSNKSVDNIRLYERVGYITFKEIDTPADYKLVYMEKMVPMVAQTE